MKELHSNSLGTNFVMLDENMKPCKEVYEGREGGERHTRQACFASVRDWMRREGYYSNKVVRYVKYMPWITTADVNGFPEALDAWLNMFLSIPFVRARVVEHTGYLMETAQSRAISGCDDRYFIVDMKEPVDEGTAILQTLRVPQEFPGRIKTFHDVMKDTGCERTAFLASLLYLNSKGAAAYGGHCPTNGISIKWAHEFIKDPSIAQSIENKWNSNVFGRGARVSYPFKEFVGALKGGDPAVIPVAVYGSLRQGFGNNKLLSNAAKEYGALFKGEVRVPVHCKMYDLGAFPALHPAPTAHKVTFEVYEVNNATMQKLDALEGYPDFYDRTQMLIGDMPCWVYFHRNKPNDRVVETGDWAIHKRAS